MKKFYLFLLMSIVTSVWCNADIITKRPEGNLKFYQRTSGLTYLNDGTQLHLQNQAGFTEIVYSTDGKTAWIKNPISGFFPESSEECAWVEGSLSGDGKTITVKLGQRIFFDESQNEYIALAVLDKDETAHSTNYLYNTLEVQVKYQIDGDKVSLLNTSEKKILGLVWESDKAWCGFGDYETVYTEYELPESVTPPASMETKTYNLSAIEYMDEKDRMYSTTVEVGFDGDDVYIKGIDKFIPFAWIKGTLSGSTVTFDVQYIGTDPGQRRHFLTGWNGGAVGPLVLNYYKDLDAFETTSPLIINSNPTMHNYYAYYRSLYIGDRPDPIEKPEGLKTTRMTMAGKMDNTGLFYRAFTRTVEIAMDGDQVYFRGLCFSLPEAWALGTLKDGVVTIPSGQFIGFDESSAIYLHGISKDLVEWQDLQFDYNATENSFTSKCVMLETSARQPRSYIWRYEQGMKIYFDADAPTGADPDDLTSVTYTFEGECYSSTSLMPNGKFSRKVSIALDGNLVYIKGLSPELPDAWVKGEMLDNKVTFACPQKLGNDGTQDLYFTGVDLNAWVLQDFELAYNPDDESYEFIGLALINKSAETPQYTVWYYMGCKLKKDAAGIDDITVDSENQVKTVYNLQGLPVKGELRNGQIYIINGKKVLYRN